MKSGYSRYLYTFLIVLLVIALGFRIFTADDEIGSDDRALARVGFLDLQDYLNIENKIEAVGRIRSEDRIILRSEVNSPLASLLVRPGDQVQMGQVVAIFDNEMANLQVEQAIGGLDLAMAQLSSLMNSASEEDIERSELALSQAKSGLASAEAELARVLLLNKQNIRNREIAIDNLYRNALLAGKTAESSLRSSLALMADNRAKYPACFDASACERLARYIRESVEVAYDIRGADNWNSASLSSINVGVRNDLRELDEEMDGILLRSSIERLISGLQLARQGLETQKVIFDPTLSPNNVIPQDRATIDSSIQVIDGQLQALQGQLQGFDTNEGGIIGGEPRLLQEIRISASQAESQARLGIENAKSAVRAAEVNLEQLLQGPREVDLAPVRAQVRQAEAGLAVARLQADRHIIRAPFTGEVGSVSVEIGDVIPPGQPILSLVNSSALEVVVEMSARDAILLNQHTRVLIGDHGVEGIISYVGSSIDDNSGNIEVGIIVVGEGDNLIIGDSVRVEFIVSSESEDFYTVPLSAVRASVDGFSVLIEKDGKVQEIFVDTGNIRGDRLEISFRDELPDRIISSVRGFRVGQEIAVE